MTAKNNKGPSKIVGILMIICGIVAMGSPFLMGAIMTSMIGIMLILGGISEMFISFSNGWKAGLLTLLTGLLTIMAGVVVLKNPLFASSLFTILMVGYFIADGIIRSVGAFKLKGNAGWGLALFSGIMSVVLGFMLMQGWPVSGLMAIGIFAGVRLLFRGMNMLSGASATTEA